MRNCRKHHRNLTRLVRSKKVYERDFLALIKQNYPLSKRERFELFLFLRTVIFFTVTAFHIRIQDVTVISFTLLIIL